MSQTAEHSGSLSLDGLQRSLWQAEAGLKKVTKIEVVGTKTISTHDDDPKTKAPRRTLILIEDNAAGDITAPAGAEEKAVCRGEALIGGTKKKVAAFRKKPAAAAGGATPAPATPAPSTPAPSTSTTSGDQTTGPEGNPDLNPDGTPKKPAGGKD